MTTILCQRLTNISYHLSYQRQDYCPIYGLHRDEKEPIHNGVHVPPIVEWCRGFMSYLSLATEAWEPIFETESGRRLIWPFILYGTDTGWSAAKQYEVVGSFPFRDQFSEYLSHYVFGVQDYFQAPYYVDDISDFLAYLAPNWPAPTSASQVIGL